MLYFLALGLSADGYNTVLAVVGADGVLAKSPVAGRLGFGEDNYWLAFLGQPSAAEPWGWQFGGHHLAVNMAVNADRITMSPTFIGIEPASYVAGTYTAAPLAAELEAGLALINALEGKARTLAAVNNRPEEMYTGAGQDGVILLLEGSPVADWSPGQQQSLLETAALWSGMLPAHKAQLRLAEIEAGLNETFFAWHGAPDGSGPIHCRIQGPTLIIKFSTQGSFGTGEGHCHSVYRDPTNEYGLGREWHPTKEARTHIWNALARNSTCPQPREGDENTGKFLGSGKRRATRGFRTSWTERLPNGWTPGFGIADLLDLDSPHATEAPDHAVDPDRWRSAEFPPDRQGSCCGIPTNSTMQNGLWFRLALRHGIRRHWPAEKKRQWRSTTLRDAS